MPHESQISPSVFPHHHLRRDLQKPPVVLAAGMKARSQEAEQFRGLSLFFEPVGDCVVAKNVRGATRSGFDAASRI